MPKIIVYFLLILSSISFGQSIESILQQKRQQIDRVETKPSDRITYISSNFANSQITTINLRDKVGVLAVTKVYYVYTAYKRSAGFNQMELDRQRFKQLKVLYPTLFENQLIEWEILEQTGLEIYTKGEGYFHGFILIHRPLPSEERKEKEFSLVNRFLNDPFIDIGLIDEDPIEASLKKELNNNSPQIETKEAGFDGGGQALYDYIQANLSTPSDVWKDRKDFWAKFSLVIDETGKPLMPEFKDNYSRSTKKEITSVITNMPNWNPKQINGQAVKDTIDFEWRISYSPQVKGMFLIDGKPPILNHESNYAKVSPSEPNRIGTADIAESSVYQSFNKVPENENLAIVMDVTGSMANHIISASFWLNQNVKKLPFTSFTAFNDGDDKKDDEKEIGQTGGIYFTAFFTEFNNSILTAMQKGNGGDYPENDIEAILYAERKDVKATGVLLVADNFSAVKDIELLKKVNLPVNVMPCGLTGSIHQNYLDIAFKTKGKIYYKGQVIDFQSLSKGDVFKIRKTDYLFTGRGVEIVN